MEHQFDRFAKTVAAGLSRRNAIKWFSSVVSGTLLGAWVGEGRLMSANSTPPSSPLHNCQAYCANVLPQQRAQCQDACVHCKGNTQDLCGTPGALLCCPSGTVCCRGTDACGSNVSACTDLSSDPNNCGTCGNICFAGTCVNGACVINCPTGQTVCGNVCTDLTRDSNNCGACGNVCSQGALCENGQCGCVNPLTFCPGTGCTNLATDFNNCGACGTVCSSGEVCVDATCLTGCPSNMIDCGTSGSAVCCAGTGCCGTGFCQTQHSDGLGQSYFDCYPLNTYTDMTAMEACAAARDVYGGDCVPVQQPSCGGGTLTVYTVVLTNSANIGEVIWCYGGPCAGYVSIDTVLCGVGTIHWG